MTSDLESAEQLTRLLRKKGEKPQYLLQVARKLFQGKINVYLPRKNLVLIDWLLDKLQEDKTWRSNSHAWEMLSDVWIVSEDDITARSYGNHKFSVILSDTLKEIMSSADNSETIASLCSKVARAVRIINKNVNNVLGDLLVLANWLYENHITCFESSEFLDLVQIISDKTSVRTGVRLKLCLPLLSIDPIPTVLEHVLKSVVQANKDTAVTQISPVKSLQASQDVALILTRVFTILLDDKDTKKVHSKFILESFIDLALSLKCLNGVANLLELTLKNQLSASDEILKKVLSETTDVEILKRVIQLNSELVIGKEAVINVFETPLDADMALHIVRSFVISRRLDEFFNIWAQLSSSDSGLWTTDEVYKVLTSALTKSTPFQLLQLLGTFKNDSQVTSLIVKTLPTISASLSILDTLLCEIAVSTKDWSLKYNILLLNSDIVKICHNKILNSIGTVSDESPVEMIYCIFRIKELGHEVTIWGQVVTFIENHLKDLLTAIMTRWFVLLDKELPTHVLQLISSHLRYTDSTEIFGTATESALLYEQTNLVSVILHDLTYKQEELTTPLCMILTKFPIEVIPRASRLHLLDKLIEMPVSAVTMGLIQHLLSRPTPRSKFESDPEALIKFFEKSQKKEETEGSVIQLFDMILERKASEATIHTVGYLQALTSQAAKMLKRKKTKSLRLAAILSNFDESLAQSLVSIVKTQGLDVSMVPYLNHMPAEQLLHLKEDIAKVSLLHFETCFPALCKGSSSKDDVLSLIALFICQSAVGTSDFSAVNPAFLEAIAVLDSESFKDILSQVILGAVSTNEPQYFAVIYALAKKLYRDENTSCGPLFIKIFCCINQRVSAGKLNNEKSLQLFLLIEQTLLREKSWAVNQFMLETVLVSICNTSKLALNDEELFSSCCQTMAAILLFHRHRINGRYHMIMLAFRMLMEWLFKLSNATSISISAVQVYSRLLTNLCEPSVRAVRDKGGKNQLSSLSSIAKRQLAKFLPSLLLCYVSACLHIGMSAEFREELKPGVYAIIDVLGATGLKTASCLMDYSSRAYLRPLYDDYRLHGKWQATNS